MSQANPETRTAPDGTPGPGVTRPAPPPGFHGSSDGPAPQPQAGPDGRPANVVMPGGGLKGPGGPTADQQRAAARVTVVSTLYYTPGPGGGETRSVASAYEFPAGDEQPYRRTARLRPGVWTEAERGWLEASGVGLLHLRADGGPVGAVLSARRPADTESPALLLFAGEGVHLRPASGVRAWLRPLGGGGDRPAGYTLTAFPC